MPSQVQFGTDGWRAVIADTYTFANVRIAAQGCAEYFIASGKADRGIVVGYDTRFGSDRFAQAVVEVLAANGIPVRLTSRFQPTPIISYAVLDRQAGGAIIITASHNPPTDNGFKVKSEAGASAPPEVIAEIEQAIERVERAGGAAAVKRMPFADATVDVFDPTPAFDAQVARLVDLDKLRRAGISIVADAMYGTGSGVFTRLLAGGTTTVHQIRGEVNPAFPGISPEPIRPHIDALSRAVPAMGAQIGLATDGDSDRIGLVDEHGTFISQHQVFGLLLLYLTEVRGRSGSAVRSVTMSSMGDRYMQERGDRVIETPVGFKYIGATMVAEDALLGGEESGGFGFRGHLPERDAIVAGLFLVDLMVTLERPMSGVMAYLRERLGDWHYSRVDVRYPTADRDAIADRVARARPADLDGSPVTHVGTIDGYKYYAEDGSWLLIRFSGTEPLLRIYTETTGSERVQRLLAQGRTLAGA